MRSFYSILYFDGVLAYFSRIIVPTLALSLIYLCSATIRADVTPTEIYRAEVAFIYRHVHARAQYLVQNIFCLSCPVANPVLYIYWLLR